MRSIKISTFLVMVLISGKSIAQFSLGLDMISEKEFFQYGFLKGNHDFVRREVHYIGTSGDMVHSTIISGGSARHWLLRFQYNF